jgi:hypothetical protein
MADMVMHMLPARRVAAATRLAAALPVVAPPADEDAGE